MFWVVRAAAAAEASRSLALRRSFAKLAAATERAAVERALHAHNAMGARSRRSAPTPPPSTGLCGSGGGFVVAVCSVHSCWQMP